MIISEPRYVSRLAKAFVAAANRDVRGARPEHHPPLKSGLTRRPVRKLCESPALREVTGPALLPAPDADEALHEFVDHGLTTLWHPVGTCRRGTGEESVVGPDLAVHGVAGLHVADASVMPTVTRGNTQAPTIMIAERAAEILRSSVALG